MDYSKGFTLVETLIVITIAALVGAILVAIFVSSNSLFYQQSARIAQGVSLNSAVSQIRESIKAGVFVVSSYPQPSPVYTTSSQTIVLALPAIDSTGQVIEAVYDYLIITKDATNPKILRKIILPDSTSSRKSENRVLTTKLSEITFLYQDQLGNQTSPTSASEINFTVNISEKTTGQNNEASSASAQVNLRND